MRFWIIFASLLVVQDVFTRAANIGDPNRTVNRRWWWWWDNECDELSDLLIKLKDDVLEFYQWVLQDDYDRQIAQLNILLPGDVTDDSTWTELACQVEDVDTIEDVVALHESYGMPEVSIDDVRRANHMIIVIKSSLEAVTPKYKELVVATYAWIRKTHYPDVFPIPNTSVEEVQALFDMRDEVMSIAAPLVSLATNNAQNRSADSNDLAVKLLESSTFEESLGLEGYRASDRKYLLNYFHAAQSPEFEKLVIRIPDHILALLRYLDEIGFFEL